jgi:hypothetical protein
MLLVMLPEISCTLLFSCTQKNAQSKGWWFVRAMCRGAQHLPAQHMISAAAAAHSPRRTSGQLPQTAARCRSRPGRSSTASRCPTPVQGQPAATHITHHLSAMALAHMAQCTPLARVQQHPLAGSCLSDTPTKPTLLHETHTAASSLPLTFVATIFL